MSDARINTAIASHPKTKKLIKIAGTDAAWRLICLFLWVAHNKPDGNLSGMMAEDIELAVDWPGDDGAFVGALVSVGFIDGCETDGYLIHDWAEHNPWAAGSEKRSEKARFNALCKHFGKDEAASRMPEYAASRNLSCKNSARSMQAAEQNSASSMHDAKSSSAPSPSPSPSPKELLTDASHKSAKETELQQACRKAWASYAESYERRYKTPPVRNQRVSSQLKSFVQRVGFEEAELIAGWFVSHPGDFYIKNLHSVGCLLSDAEKLRTQWATGNVQAGSSGQHQTAKQISDSAQLRAIGWTPEMTQALKEKQQGRLIEGTVL